MQKSINNKFICIILARKGSKRIKNKNLRINQKPLITYTINAIKKLMPLNNIYVSTNDKKIIKIVKNKINLLKDLKIYVKIITLQKKELFTRWK